MKIITEHSYHERKKWFKYGMQNGCMLNGISPKVNPKENLDEGKSHLRFFLTHFWETTSQNGCTREGVWYVYKPDGMQKRHALPGY